MSTNYHTAISTGAAADASTFNSPMGELDAQITINTSEITDARGSQASLDARLDTSLNNAGNLKSGAVSAQSMVNLGDAAAANGDAARYEEFTQEHNANGTHSTTDEIITKQAQLNVDSVSAASGDLVRHDEFTQEHNADGTHSTTDEIITKQAQLNVDSVSAASGDLVRHDEFTQEHNADGTHDAGVIEVGVITEVTWQESDNNDAPALRLYRVDGDAGSGVDNIIMRGNFYHNDADYLKLVIYVYNSTTTGTPFVTLYANDDAINQSETLSGTGWRYQTVSLDITGLTDGRPYDFKVEMGYQGANGAIENIQAKEAVVFTSD